MRNRHRLVSPLSVVVALVLAIAGLATLAGPVSAARKASVTLKPLPAQSEVGKKVTLKGSFSGGRATVKLQTKGVAGGWRTVAKVTTTKQGAFKKKVKLTTGGTTSFRAVKGSAKSQARTLKVYAWLDLATQPFYALNGPFTAGSSAGIGGRAFPASIVGDESAMVGVRTAGLCTHFDTWTGFLDGHGPGAGDGVQRTAVGTLNAAGGVLAETQATTPPGPAKRVALSLVGSHWFVADIGIDGTSTPDTMTVLGSPRLRCNAARLAPFVPAAFPDLEGEPGPI
ncbi:hypothetical protein [Nocardioides sp. SYSU D00038]|uniref:hypothetical protein n=1 Tax=Nocardioides sp. SYSU D00038 TaxID=2812554 RepID=UPI0019674874|nr:hypothetical protein [Nocardioides sp. SYSU D00038]